VTLNGHWIAAPAGAIEDPYRVDAFLGISMERAALVMYLLEPESEDGFATWNGFGDAFVAGQPYPVLRIPFAPSPGAAP
jgi:hypothetical protein